MPRFVLGASNIVRALFGLIAGVAVIAATIPAVYYQAGDTLRRIGSSWPATIAAGFLLGTYHLFRYLPFVALYAPLKGIHLSLTRGMAYTARFLLSNVLSELGPDVVRPPLPLALSPRAILPPPIFVKDIVQQQLDKNTQRLIAQNNFHQFQSKLTELEEKQFQTYINSIEDPKKKVHDQAKLDEYVSYMRQETLIQLTAYKDIADPVTLEWKANGKPYYSTYDKNDELAGLTMNSNPITRKPLDARDSKIYAGYKPAIMVFISYVREAIKAIFSPKNKMVVQAAANGSRLCAARAGVGHKISTLAVGDQKSASDSDAEARHAFRVR